MKFFFIASETESFQRVIKSARSAYFILFVLFLIGGSIASAQVEKDPLGSTLDQISRLSGGEKNMLLSTMGVGDVSGFSLAKIFAWIIFGGVGFVAFAYGKKQSSPKPLVIGILLMVYPYFLSTTVWLYTVGVGLCLLLYFWKD